MQNLTAPLSPADRTRLENLLRAAAEELVRQAQRRFDQTERLRAELRGGPLPLGVRHRHAAELSELERLQEHDSAFNKVAALPICCDTSDLTYGPVLSSTADSAEPRRFWVGVSTYQPVDSKRLQPRFGLLLDAPAAGNRRPSPAAPGAVDDEENPSDLMTFLEGFITARRARERLVYALQEDGAGSCEWFRRHAAAFAENSALVTAATGHSITLSIIAALGIGLVEWDRRGGYCLRRDAVLRPVTSGGGTEFRVNGLFRPATDSDSNQVVAAENGQHYRLTDEIILDGHITWPAASDSESVSVLAR